MRNSHISLHKENMLGKGAYGKVYRCEDEKGNEYAVKCIDVDTECGIPCLVETIIMSCFKHPNINSAFKIYINKDKLYILQEIAHGDLKHDIAEHVRGQEDLRRCLFEITLGIYFLHQNSVIHADIKAGNILIGKDGKFKITDFTLSSLFHWKHKHLVCTSTHRPPEVWQRKAWDERIDIWSLGCVFFEIVYGCYLFPNQAQKRSDTSPSFTFEEITEKNLNCIADWCNYNPLCDDEDLSFRRYDVDYIKPYIPKHFNIYSPFNQLLLKMLHPNPAKRIDLLSILNDKYFQGGIPLHITSKGRIREIPEHRLPENFELFLKEISKCYAQNSVITDFSERLYKKLYGLRSIGEKDKIKCCYGIAFKLIIGFIPKEFQFESSKFFIYEKTICEHLNYCLYSSQHVMKFLDK